jgi:hypothetical protein
MKRKRAVSALLCLALGAFAQDKVLYDVAKDAIRLFVEGRPSEQQVAAKDIKAVWIKETPDGYTVLEIAFLPSGREKFRDMTLQNGNRNLVVASGGDELFKLKIREPFDTDSILLSAQSKEKMDDLLMMLDASKR